MQNANLFAIIAMTLYATESFIADVKLSRIPPLTLTFYYSFGVMVFAGTTMFLTRTQNIPSGSQWLYVVLMVVCSFGAAVAHFSSLHFHAGAIKLTTFYMFLPVVASVLGIIFLGKYPSIRILLAWCLGALALYLISTDN